MSRKYCFTAFLCLIIFLTGFSFSSAQEPRKTPDPKLRLMAREAAVEDARLKLAEKIYAIKMNQDTSVKDLLVRDEKIVNSLNAALGRAKVVDSEWNSDGVCIVEMELPVAVVQNILKRPVPWKSDVIRSTGKGIPGARLSGTSAKKTPPPEKTWYNLVIRASGKGAPPKNVKDAATGKLMAERAAYAEALEQLEENIKEVRVSSRTTIRNFAAKNNHIHAKLRQYVQGARKVGVRHYEDGTCRVEMEISLSGLKKILSEPPPTPHPHPNPSLREQ